MAENIPERIFKIAADRGGIPFSFREDENELVITLVDGRKLILEKELGTRKRIQQAEAEQAEAEFKQAETAYSIAKTTAEVCLTTMQHLEAKAKSLRLIADGKTPAVAASTPPANAQSPRGSKKEGK